MTGPEDEDLDVDLEDEISSDSEDETDSDSEDEDDSDSGMEVDSGSEHIRPESRNYGAGVSVPSYESLERDDACSREDNVSGGLDALVGLLGEPTIRSLMEHLAKRSPQPMADNISIPPTPSPPATSSPTTPSLTLVGSSPPTTHRRHVDPGKLCGGVGSESSPIDLVRPTGEDVSDVDSPPATPSPPKRTRNTRSTESPATLRNKARSRRPQHRPTGSARPSDRPDRQGTSSGNPTSARQAAERKGSYIPMRFKIIIPTKRQYLQSL